MEDILVPIFFILMPIAIVAIVLYFSHRKEQERNRLIEKMIERGDDPEQISLLLNNGRKEEEKNPTKHFKAGVTFFTVGLGFIITGLIADWGTVGIGAFIAVIGLGEFAVAWYLRKYSK